MKRRIAKKIAKAQCNHTPTPPYPEWLDWARQKSRTHKQVRCPGCGLWHVWVPK